MKILLVDDTRSIHMYTKDLLRRISQFSYLDAYNGEEALKILNDNRDVQFVLLDWEMPVLDGYSTLLRIRELYPQLPVMIVTTKDDPNDIQKMLEAGASEYMMKPFTEDILRQKLNDILGERLSRVS